MRKWWCKLFHRAYWLSGDTGHWHTQWHVHGGKFEVACLLCGEEHEYYHKRDAVKLEGGK